MDTFVASSSSLSPPTKLRPRGSSTSVPLSIQPVSLAQVSASSSSSSASSTATARYGILEVPQTPSALVRKSTAPTTIVQDLDQLQEEDDHHNHNEHGFHSLAVPPTRQSSTGSSFSASSSSTSLSAPSSPGRHHSSSSRHHAHSNNKHSHRSHGHSRTRSRQYHADHRAASASYLAPPASIPRHAVSSYAHLDDDLEGGDDTALGSRARALLIGAAPSRPMLSVLLSLGASALPPFVPGSSSSSRRREKSPSSMMMTRKPSTASSRRRRGSNHPPTSATNSGFWTPTSSREHHPHRSGAGSSSSNGTRSASRNASARSSLDDDFPSTPFSSRFVVPPTPISLRRSSGVTTSRSRAAKLVGSSFYGPILFLIALFVATLIPIGLGVWSLPLGSYMSSGSAPASFPPKTMKEVTALAMSVRQYAVSSSGSRFHVMFVLSITAIWMHAWSIPGSVVINVIAGTLYSMSSSLSSASTFGIDGLTGALVRQREYLPWGGMIGATLHMTLLTTLGSLAASALSMPLTALVKTFFPRALDATRTALEGPSSSSSSSSSAADSSSSAVFEKHGSAAGAKKDDTPTWVRLTVMRLVGVVPWSGINVACGVVGVKWWDCFLGSFIGTMPWTAVTCQIGDIIQTLSTATGQASSASGTQETLGSVLLSPGNIAKLVVLSALSLGPVLYRDKLRSVLGGGGKSGSGSAPVAPSVPQRSNSELSMHDEEGEMEGDELSPRTSGEVDEDNILPLSYTAHDHIALGSVPSTPTTAVSVSVSAPSTTASPTKNRSTRVHSSSSEASSTVADDDEERQHHVDTEIDDESDLENRATVRAKKTASSSHRWSQQPWMMWGAGTGSGSLEEGIPLVEQH